VTYYVDITPKPIRTRGLTGMNKPPYNPIFDGPRVWNPRGSTTTSRGFTSSAGYSGTAAQPLMIINPYYKKETDAIH
jgi:hypothetical protein